MGANMDSPTGGRVHSRAEMEVCRVGKSIIQMLLHGHQVTAGGLHLCTEFHLMFNGCVWFLYCVLT